MSETTEQNGSPSDTPSSSPSFGPADDLLFPPAAAQDYVGNEATQRTGSHVATAQSSVNISPASHVLASSQQADSQMEPLDDCDDFFSDTINSILAQIQSVDARFQGERASSPWHSVWRLKRKLLLHRLKNPSVVAMDNSSKFLGMPPLVPCSTIQDWRNSPQLRNKAIELGATKFGGFVIDCPTSADCEDFAWRGSSSTGSSVLVFYQNQLKTTSLDGTFSLKLQQLAPTTSDRADPQPWARHRTSNEELLQIWDMFEAQMLRHEDRDRKQWPVGPPYVINSDALTAEDRTARGFSENSPLTRLEGNALDESNVRYMGVHDPEAFVSGDGFGAVFGAHVEDFWLESLHLVVVGAGKLMLLIPESEFQKFESWAIGSGLYNTPKGPHCGQFVRHRYSFISRKVLDREGIRYSIALVQQGQAMFFLQKVYHWGFSLGANAAESCNFASGAWTPDPAYRACSAHCGGRQGTDFITHEGLARASSSSRAAPSGSSVQPQEASDQEKSEAQTADALRGKERSTRLAQGRNKRKIAEPASSGPALLQLKKARSSARTSGRQSRGVSRGGIEKVNSANKNDEQTPESSKAVATYLAHQHTIIRQKTTARPLIKKFLYSWTDFDKKVREIIGPGKSITYRDLCYVGRLFYTAGSVEALCALREVVWTLTTTAVTAKAQYQSRSKSQTSLLPPLTYQKEMTIGQRFKYIQKLDDTFAVCNLIKRRSLADFACSFQAPLSLPGVATDSSFVIVTSGQHAKNSAKGSGRRQSKNSAKASDVDRIIAQLPGADDKDIRAQARIYRKLGERYLILSKTYGPGILVLLPLRMRNDRNEGSCIENMIYSLSDSAFAALLGVLRRKEEELKTMSRLVDPIVNKILGLGGNDGKEGFRIEQFDSEQMKAEPDCSASLIELLSGTTQT